MIGRWKLFTKVPVCGWSVRMTFLNRTKAFDGLSRCSLLSKIGIHGVVDQNLQWFLSHLPNRNQTVQITGFIPEPLIVTSSTIPANVLGSVLLLFYFIDVLLLSFILHGHKVAPQFLFEALDFNLNDMLRGLASLSNITALLRSKSGTDSHTHFK